MLDSRGRLSYVRQPSAAGGGGGGGGGGASGEERSSGSGGGGGGVPGSDEYTLLIGRGWASAGSTTVRLEAPPPEHAAGSILEMGSGSPFCRRARVIAAAARTRARGISATLTLSTPAAKGERSVWLQQVRVRRAVDRRVQATLLAWGTQEHVMRRLQQLARAPPTAARRRLRSACLRFLTALATSHPAAQDKLQPTLHSFFVDEKGEATATAQLAADEAAHLALEVLRGNRGVCRRVVEETVRAIAASLHRERPSALRLRVLQELCCPQGRPIAANQLHVVRALTERHVALVLFEDGRAERARLRAAAAAGDAAAASRLDYHQELLRTFLCCARGRCAEAEVVLRGVLPIDELVALACAADAAPPAADGAADAADAADVTAPPSLRCLALNLLQEVHVDADAPADAATLRQALQPVVGGLAPALLRRLHSEVLYARGAAPPPPPGGLSAADAAMLLVGGALPLVVALVDAWLRAATAGAAGGGAAAGDDGDDLRRAISRFEPPAAKAERVAAALADLGRQTVALVEAAGAAELSGRAAAPRPLAAAQWRVLSVVGSLLVAMAPPPAAASEVARARSKLERARRLCNARFERGGSLGLGGGGPVTRNAAVPVEGELWTAFVAALRVNRAAEFAAEDALLLDALGRGTLESEGWLEGVVGGVVDAGLDASGRRRRCGGRGGGGGRGCGGAALRRPVASPPGEPTF